MTLMSHQTRTKLFLLAALYFSQGLPFGFFTQALPVFLRKQGLSLAMISATSLLTLPWAIKFLWAPLVDRVGRTKPAHRKLWIIPLQGLAALLMFIMAWVEPSTHLWLVFFGVLIANTLAATQDIATDGLAVRMLDHEERGLGNGLQVAGYRVGMIVGGGVLLIVYDQLAWSGTFITLGVLLLLATLPVAFDTKYTHQPPTTSTAAPLNSPMVILKDLWRAIKRPGMGTWIVIMCAYKIGDAMAAGMLRPMLVDLKLEMEDIGWLLGTAGFTSGLLGAMFGGWLVGRLGRWRALIGFGALQILGSASYILPAMGVASTEVLYATCLLEHFTGGMATAALFTMMMDRCDEENSSTQYTAQASIVVLATGVGFALSGPLAQAVGYQWHYIISAIVGSLGLGVVVALSKKQT